MANEENLTHKLTVSEQRAGGKASGEARRRKREIREMLEEYLAMPAKWRDIRRLRATFDFITGDVQTDFGYGE